MRSDQWIAYYLGLQPPASLPRGVEVLCPYTEPAVQQVTRQFFQRFFRDKQPRKLILGINPGRLGAGITGINFTAPRQLSENCGIAHPLGNQSELSAEFIYTVIARYGGPETFYRHWLIGSVCPLGFIRNGRNLNYYDEPALLEKVKPFIIEQISRQTELAGRPEVCICLGEGKNLRILQQLNSTHQWFREIHPLPHPRFVMQYKRKELENYIRLYLDRLRAIS